MSNFFFNDTATTEIYTLSLHDALPISNLQGLSFAPDPPKDPKHPDRMTWKQWVDAWLASVPPGRNKDNAARRDRKSTRLNSSHANISYAVFCLKKKNDGSSTRRRRWGG